MADSPKKNTEGVVRLTIFSNGTQLKDSIQVISVKVEKRVNQIPVARIVVLDGDMPAKDFEISDADDFKPGSEIKINAGYRDQEEVIFEGVVVKHSLKITGENYSRLLIECRDKAVAMTVGRKNVNYVGAKDSDVFSKLVGNYSSLSVVAEATTTQHKELVQYYCTDWDFLVSRAEVSGAIVIVDDASVDVAAPKVSATPVLSVTYGEDLVEFQAEIDARGQYSQVTGVSWDPSVQKIVEQVAGIETLNSHGNLTSSDLAAVVGLDNFKLQTPISMESTALKDWAKSQQVKSGLSKIQGRMKFQGSSDAKPGSLIELKGVGARFSGNVFVSAICHEISDGNWFTEAEFGLPSQWFADKRDITAPSASGLLPGVDGLHIGIVSQLEPDPDHVNQIKVTVPVLQAETEGVWARLSSFYASDKYGEFFIPEIGDEVVLGYLNNDPGHPVILGSLYSAKRTPPYPITADNFIKAIVTRSELKIEFDDKNKVITIITPEKNKIIISDKDKSVLIQDKTDNKVELSSSGIVLDSPKDISIKAKGKISLDAVGVVSITSKADVKASGMNIEHDAKVGITVKGGASAELSAGGNTIVKGAMVMIN
tara:strand:- start:1477 stop:3267 length:1791 start_codon:yes stop_codon:yes gene_type:complete